MKRRQFLVIGSQTGIMLGLSQYLPLFAMASPTRGGIKNLITLHMGVAAGGGWDVICGVDPQVKKLSVSDRACFIGYRPDEIVRAGGLAFAPPAAAMAPYADRSIVINGVSMLGNISHPDCTRMAHTGIIERSTAQLAVMKAYAEKGDSLGGARVLTTESQLENGPLEVNAVSTFDVTNLINPNSNDVNDDTLDPSGFMAVDQQILMKFSKIMQDMKTRYPKIKEKLDGGNNGNGNNGGGTSNTTAATIALALKAGYVSSAHVILAPAQGTLDTHSNHKTGQPAAQMNCWSQVIDLIETLKAVPGENESASLFDETLLMITSEFSRESALNGDSIETAGKEHNGYTNSYMLIGGRVKGGRTIGESVLQYNMMGQPSLHIARNFDFSCGTVIRKREDDPVFLTSQYYEKKQIMPCHVISTLAKNFGAAAYLDPVLKDLPVLPIFL